jgi:hypothetical protein
MHEAPKFIHRLASSSGRRENAVTKLFDPTKENGTLSEVILNKDPVVALRNETPELINFIIPEDDTPCHIDDLLTLALARRPISSRLLRSFSCISFPRLRPLRRAAFRRHVPP